MVRGLGTVDVIILEVSHFDKAILDRGWMVALDLCKRKTIQIHHQSPRRTHSTQLYPEIIDPRKVNTNFLKTVFEYFRVLEARGDV